jgi:hypothetical protein
VSPALIAAVAWAVSPIFIVLGIFGLCEWFDRRRVRDLERRAELIWLEQCWEAEPYDWRRS